MQFILVKDNNGLTDDDKRRIKRIFEDTTSIICDHVDYEWVSDDNTCYFVGRNPKLEIYEKYNVFNVDEENNLSFIHGWLKYEDEDKLLDAASASFNLNFDKIDGYFNLINITSKGNGEINCSNISPSLYKSSKNNVFAISNRISPISKFFDITSVNKKHVASQIQYQNFTLNFDTMFENVYQIPFGTKICFNDKIIENTRYDFQYDYMLEKLYKNNKKLYYDECFKKLNSQIKAFVNLGLNSEFILGISGGKDSRLLLSLYYKYLKSTFTWGPVFSPEVIIGRMVSNVLGLKHMIKNSSVAYDNKNLFNDMPQHLFVREFVMCPWDFGTIPKNIIKNINIDGQEYVKIKPYAVEYTIEDMINESSSQHSNNYAITDDLMVLIREDNSRIMREYLENINNIHKFGVLKRELERGCWASRVHETIMDHGFSLYPLITNVALKYSYNIPIDAIFNEEFIYEMIKRGCPKLLELPLFNSKFEFKEVPPIDSKVPGKMNNKNHFLIQYYDYLMNYIIDNFDLISDVVKDDFIFNNLTKEKLFNNSKLSQIFYNILQYIILLKTEDFSDLKSSFSFDWSVDLVECVDTFDEDCLNAFIKYNEDIVKLKMENISLIDKNPSINEAENQEKLNNNASKIIFRLENNLFSNYIKKSQNIKFNLVDNGLEIAAINSNPIIHLESINNNGGFCTINISFNADNKGIFKISYTEESKEIFLISEYVEGFNELEFYLPKGVSLDSLKLYPMDNNSKLIIKNLNIVEE